MGPRRTTTELIPDSRARGDTFRERSKGLRKKAWQLSVLCGVDVALVVAKDDGGAGPADVWESNEGVLEPYRTLAPEARVRHAQRAYLDGELGKAEAKLARVRQGGPGVLRGWEDRALDGVTTAGEARALLEVIDAAIRAADARRRALGVPADDDDDEDGGGAGVVIEGIAPQLLNCAVGVVVDGGDCYAPHHGPGCFDDDANGQIIWGNDGGFQPRGAADMQMQSGGYGFRQCGTTSGGGTEGYHNLQMAPAMYGNSNGCLVDAYPYQLPGHAQAPNLAPTWSAAEPRHAMVPVEYYYPSDSDTGLGYNYTMDTQAAANASLQGNGGWSLASSGNFLTSPWPPELSLAAGGGNFVDAPPAPAALARTTGRAGDNFTIADATPAQPLAMMSYDGDLTDAGWYASQCQWQAAPEPQRDGGGQQPVEQLHYLSDLEDTQLHLWGS